MRTLFLVLMIGCAGADEPRSICEEAEQAFLGCGVSVPLVNDGPCAGLRHSVALFTVTGAASAVPLTW